MKESPMPKTTCNPRKTFLALGCLGIAYVVLALSTRPVLEHVSDSYQWIEAVRNPTAENLLHPHHLLYNMVAFCWHGLLAFFGVRGAWLGVAAMSAIAGAGTLIVAARLVASKTTAAYGLAAAALLGATYSFWYFSGEVETYVPAAFAATAAFAVLCGLDDKSTRRLALAALLWSAAVLLHQSLVFMAPAVAFAAWRSSRDTKQALRRIGFLWLSAAAICCAAYAAGAFAAGGATGLRGIARWATKFGGYGYYGGIDRWSAVRAAVGLGRSIIHGRLLYEAVWSGAQWPVLVGLGAPVAYTASALVLILLKILGNLKTVWRNRTPFAAATVWFFSQTAFSLYFDPGNVEWWVIPMVPLVIALAVGFAQASAAEPTENTWILVFTAGVVFFANFSQDFSLLNDEKRNCNVASAGKIAKLADARDLVVAPVFLKPRIAYAEHGEVHANVISMHTLFKDAREDRSRAEAELERRIRITAEQGGKVFFLDRLITEKNASLHKTTPRDTKAMLLKHLKASRRKTGLTLRWPDNRIGKPWPKVRVDLFVGIPRLDGESSSHHR